MDENKRIEESRTFYHNAHSQYRHTRPTQFIREALDHLSFLLSVIHRQREVINMYEGDPMSTVIRFRHATPPAPYKTDKEREAEELMVQFERSQTKLGGEQKPKFGGPDYWDAPSGKLSI